MDDIQVGAYESADADEAPVQPADDEKQERYDVEYLHVRDGGALIIKDMRRSRKYGAPRRKGKGLRCVTGQQQAPSA